MLHVCVGKLNGQGVGWGGGGREGEEKEQEGYERVSVEHEGLIGEGVTSAPSFRRCKSLWFSSVFGGSH